MRPLKGLRFVALVVPTMTSNGAVSPMTRAMARVTPVPSPAIAVGSTTFTTVRHLGTPSA
jgi:hypothetical protein